MLFKLILLDFFIKINTTIYYIAVIGSVYKLTASATSIGIISFAMIIPSMVLGIFSGSFFKINKLAQNLIFCTILKSLVLILISFCYQNIFIIFIGMFVIGVLEQIIKVSKLSIDANAVEKNLRIVFNSKKTLFGNIAIISGPAIGGLMAAYFNFNIVLFILSVISLIPLIFMSTIKNSNGNILTENKEIKVSLKENISHLANNKSVFFMLLSYCVVIIILEMEAPLIFPFVKEQFNGTAKMSGILFSLSGIGGILGALIPIYYKIKSEINAIAFLIVFDGLLFLSFTFITNFYLSAFIFMFFGIISAVTIVLVETKIQNDIESPYRPFAFSIMQFSSGALGASAAVISGILADSYGSVSILKSAATVEIITGCLMFLIILYFMKKNITQRFKFNE